ncbi:MAG TPA: Uma2 family endonuclease [Methylomirabilota bacterium]|nr:Uma2 family endonuclease [Methylomirabilota bacterium]
MAILKNSITYQTRRWTRAEYGRLTEIGVFRADERLELIGGDLIVRERQGGPHSAAIELINEALRAAFGSGWRIRIQLPVALDDESEPEPDFSVVTGAPRDASLEPKPSCPVLVVEVAESSLAFDRNVKSSLYARARVADYWIVNLVDRVLEVYREPAAAAEAPFGWHYGQVQTLRPGDSSSPLALPSARIAVADLLP